MEGFEVRTAVAASADARTITDDVDGCVVSDRIGFELRPPLHHIPGLARALRAVVQRLFRHRQHRIVRRFGSR